MRKHLAAAARNGEIVATGEGYKTRNGAIRVTESMRRNAMQAKLKVLNRPVAPGPVVLTRNEPGLTLR